MIKKYVQGERKTDPKLYCLIGKIAIDSKIHNELGVAVTGNDGDLWYLWLDEMNTVFGFCQMRIGKNKQAHIRYLWADKLGMKIKNELIEWALTDAKQQKCPLIFTNDRETAGIWNLFNF
ncbi:hypothetical protein V3O24_04395, partial [Methylobacter sp. Wu8]|uniref:hypothetical protein n=1 Tax=Methylobacter sp. Wu8 TaxID=3118457 RepID=UPI002F2E75A2